MAMMTRDEIKAKRSAPFFAPPISVEIARSPVAYHADVHRLRFELARVIQHFKDNGVPEDLREWYDGVVELMRATNSGQSWSVEE
jgi:hypothetical protein